MPIIDISSPVSDPPYDFLLMQAQATLRLVDYQRAAGVPGVTIRHTRNRFTVRGERPCISILMVGDEPVEEDRQLNMGETVRRLQLRLQADFELAPEISATDPTGVRLMGRVLAAAERALRLEKNNGGTFHQVYVDTVEAGSIDPDENSTSDEGRLVRDIDVLYRVRSDDSNVLLYAGVNA